MDDLFLLWLSLSLSGSLVALTLVLLRPILRRFRKTWQYYLWLLVLLRLLLPFSPGGGIVGGLFYQMDTQLSTQSETASPASGGSFSDGTQAPAPSHSGALNLEDVHAENPIFVFAKKHVLSLLCLAVAILLLVRKAIGYGRFLTAMRRETCEITEGPLPAALQAACRSLGIRKQVAVCVNPLVRSPLLVGILTPMVVLPKMSIPAPELMMIFRHELTHYRRMDFLYKWLAEITVCLHWFNPLAYWVRRQINQDCEFSCDETVVSHLTHAERQTYGETLLRSISVNSSSIALLSLNGDGKRIKKRLDAIMQYRKASKRAVFTATVLTIALLCGAVFAGAYTMAVPKSAQPTAAVGPIRVSGKDLAPGGKISLGAQALTSGTECKAVFTWSGNSGLTVLCTSSGGAAKSLPLESGKATTFQVEVDGEYTIAVKNNSTHTVSNVNGSIEFKHSAQLPQPQSSNSPAALNPSTAQTVVYETVEMRRYEEADGHPYIYDTMVNHTTKRIVGGQYGMLAFDKDGNPLKIDWWGLDTDAESTYFYLADSPREIDPAKTYDVRGGWSLNIRGTDLNAEKIAYVLYCNKEITFEDGTVWSNPDFDGWRSTYEGKKTAVSALKGYYPYEQKITF